MGWTEPKTDWLPGDGIKAGDLNRVEGNIEALAGALLNIESAIVGSSGEMFILSGGRVFAYALLRLYAPAKSRILARISASTDNYNLAMSNVRPAIAVFNSKPNITTGSTLWSSLIASALAGRQYDVLQRGVEAVYPSEVFDIGNTSAQYVYAGA